MLRFVEVNRDNWQECIALPTSDAHRHVAPNVYSIAEVQFRPEAHAYCLYDGERMVGFAMYGLGEQDNTRVEIDRLMIAEPSRGRGLGTQALAQIIEEAAAMDGVSRVVLSTHPDNHRARHVYEKVGFRATGQKHGEEDEYCYSITP